MTDFGETTYSGATTVIPYLKEHISSLRGSFQKYFPNNGRQYDLVTDPFNALTLAAEEDQLIKMTSD